MKARQDQLTEQWKKHTWNPIIHRGKGFGHQRYFFLHFFLSYRGDSVENRVGTGRTDDTGQLERRINEGYLMVKNKKFNTICLSFLLIFLLIPMQSCSILFQDKGVRQDKQATITYRHILKRYSLVSPELYDNVLYFFRNLPTKRHNVGELCRYDVKKSRYTAISQEISGFVGIRKVSLNHVFISTRSRAVSAFDQNSLQQKPFIEGYEISLLSIIDSGSFWIERCFLTDYFSSLIYVNNDYQEVWRFTIERPENKKSCFLYPRIYVKQGFVHIFSYDTGKITHHVLQLQSGKVEVQEVLLIKADYFDFPIERKPYEDILIDEDTCYLFSSQGNQLSIREFCLQNQSYAKTDQIDYVVDSVLDFSRVRFGCVKKINDLIIIPVEIGLKSEKRIGSEQPENWKKTAILYLNTKQHEIIRNQEIPNQSVDKIWISEDQSKFFLIDEFDSNFSPIQQQEASSFNTNSIVCIDIATRSIQWQKDLEQQAKIKYHEAYFWTYTNKVNKPILRMNEQGEITDTIELFEAKASYQKQQEKDKKIPFRTGSSWFIDVFPIHQNKAIITTSNGYVYNWTKKEGTFFNWLKQQMYLVKMCLYMK